MVGCNCSHPRWCCCSGSRWVQQGGKERKALKKGEKYFSENKLREAIIEYRNVIKLEPKDAKARYKLGLAYSQMGQFRDAFSELSKSVDLDGNLMDARVQLGNLLLISRDIKMAKVQAETVLSKEPKNSSGHLLMSSIHLAEKDLDQGYLRGEEGDRAGSEKYHRLHAFSQPLRAKKGFVSGGKDLKGCSKG